MRQRVTSKTLRPIVARINRMTGHRETAWEDGKCNIGTYMLSESYGGYNLTQIVSEGGAERDVLRCGHMPARELEGILFAYIAGLDDAERAHKKSKPR